MRREQIQMVNTEMRISDLKHTMKEIEKKYEKRERIQMVNNEKRFSAVEHFMRVCVGEFRRSYDEKERNEKSENEARLATAKDTTKNMMFQPLLGRCVTFLKWTGITTTT